MCFGTEYASLSVIDLNLTLFLGVVDGRHGFKPGRLKHIGITIFVAQYVNVLDVASKVRISDVRRTLVKFG